MKDKFIMGDVDVEGKFEVEYSGHDTNTISGNFSKNDIIDLILENGIEPLDIFEEEDLIQCIKDEGYIVEEDV